jgi:general stress protein 26
MAVSQITARVFPPEKRWAYLERAKTIRVATTNADGSIYLTPLWFVVHERHLYIVVDTSSHGENFLAGRPLAALVDQGDEYVTVSGLRILGTVRLVEDQALVETLQGVVFEKYFHVGHPHAEAYFEFGEWAGRRYFELVPDRMIGWDSREKVTPQGRQARTLPDHVGDRRVADAS